MPKRRASASSLAYSEAPFEPLALLGQGVGEDPVHEGHKQEALSLDPEELGSAPG